MPPKSPTLAAVTERDEHIAAVTASQERLRDAQAKHAELAAQLRKLPDAEGIARAWAQGDESWTAEDYVTAQAAHKRLLALTERAHLMIGRAERALVPADLSLALTMADALTEAYGFDATATALEPKVLSYEDGAPPRFVVRQIGECVPREGEEAHAGRVTVTLVRGEAHRDLDKRDLLARLERVGWRFPARSDEVVVSMPVSGGKADELIVHVLRGGTAEALEALDRAAREAAEARKPKAVSTSYPGPATLQAPKVTL